MEAQTAAVPSLEATAVPQVSVAATPSLAAPVPQIVITKASPLNQDPSTPSVAENVAVNIPADVSETAAAHVSPESPKQAEKEDSGEEFAATEDCGQCIVPVPQSSEATESQVAETREETVIRTDTMESDESGFTSMPRYCRQWGGCRGFYFRMADAFVGMYSLPFWIILLGIPVSAGFMGGKYMDECPGRSNLPTLVFLLSIGGVILLSAQICCIISSSVCRGMESCVKTFLTHIAYIAGVTTFISLIAESFVFLSLTPDFDRLSRVFCHQTFYEYTQWMNWTVWGVILLILIIRCPVTCIRTNSGQLDTAILSI